MRDEKWKVEMNIETEEKCNAGSQHGSHRLNSPIFALSSIPKSVL